MIHVSFLRLPVLHKARTHLAEKILFGSTTLQKLPPPNFRFANRGTLKKKFPSIRQNLEIHENVPIDVFVILFAHEKKKLADFPPPPKIFPVLRSNTPAPFNFKFGNIW